MLEKGIEYTRDAIVDELQGDAVSFLPHNGHSVLYACLRLEDNPDAPLVILPGHKPNDKFAGSLLRNQTGTIPIFIKRGNYRWEYVGDYEVHHPPDAKEIAHHEHNAQRHGKNGVSMVIYMREVTPPRRTAYP